MTLLLTTAEAWHDRFDPATAPCGRASGDTEALAVADALFPAGQVVAVTLDPADGDGPIDPSRAVAVRYARRGPDGRHVALLARPAAAEALDLAPHPEGGWFRETWATSVRLNPPDRPGERVSATGIYFLLPPGEESMWHVVRSDEVWLWHRGGPLTLLLGGSGHAPAEPREIVLGPAIEAGQRPQALVPAGVWQAARPAGPEEVLVSCVVSPGFDFADFRVR
ncbi:cupin domain-containing protein [Actinomadura craniellae]|uniref:Cupin domain-containing protein n=1 Tax=Actinomadura craniellae TaxID=2231787 RepID=A0A365H2X4_9ACTN|nr:cupin domain-containing protein [Actinomadura craniellae]RAY13455.1 cupin domain-containing protein [Actinomadura craniellae]